MNTIVHFFNEIMLVLNYIAKNVPWDAVAASGVLTGVLAGPQKLAKKWFKNHEQVIIIVIAIAGPAVVALWSYVLHAYGTDPRILLLQGLAISFMTQPFYFIVWKPFVVKKFWPSVVKWFASQYNEAEKLNEAKTAVEPAGGLSTTQTGSSNGQATVNKPKVTVPIQDFKQ